MSGTPKDDLYCFAASDDGQIVGCIFFSRITFESDLNAFILAPIAVKTDCQGKGIGQKLIMFGLDALSKDGVGLAITYGDHSFYAKLGSQSVTVAMIPAPLTLQHPEGWLAQSLTVRTFSRSLTNQHVLRRLTKLNNSRGSCEHQTKRCGVRPRVSGSLHSKGKATTRTEQASTI